MVDHELPWVSITYHFNLEIPWSTMNNHGRPQTIMVAHELPWPTMESGHVLLNGVPIFDLVQDHGLRLQVAMVKYGQWPRYKTKVNYHGAIYQNMADHGSLWSMTMNFVWVEWTDTEYSKTCLQRHLLCHFRQVQYTWMPIVDKNFHRWENGLPDRVVFPAG